MKRLTKWEDKNAASINGVSPLDKDFAMAINRLAEYEDLEEQGLLVRLPCKVGNKIYLIIDGKTVEREVSDTTIDRYGTFIGTTRGDTIPLCEFGKTVFSSLEEAEKILEENKQ